MAFQRALDARFGIETDVRDRDGNLVIAHDPCPAGMSADAFMELWTAHSPESALAINVKADGLLPLLQPLLRRHAVANYFCFDMSLPETLLYRRYGLRFFTRQSEYETAPMLYADAAGVWLDMFDSDWVTSSEVRRHLAAGKQVAIVSPELHGRPHLAFWAELRRMDFSTNENIMLCTDYPLTASEFFR